jgi:hypothetical protein
MYTSFVFVALGGLVATSSAESRVAWQDDYGEARKVAQAEKKPLAVFFGSGSEGFDKVCRDGQLSPAHRKALVDNYVCLYADVSTAAGKKLADAFDVSKSSGVVLSDRSGDLQAFYHNGDLSEADLDRWLKHCADPNVSVTSTRTNTAQQVSYYPPTNGTGGYGYPPAGYGYGFQPAPFMGGPSFGGGRGGC